jgi:NADPH:quinone reductase-like Zn-dependent oxidoreductase
MFWSRVCFTQIILNRTRLTIYQPVHAASLNYRDLIIPMGKYPFPMKDNIVPGSDGAGTVEAVGKHVTRFKAGGTYCSTYPTHLKPI